MTEAPRDMAATGGPSSRPPKRTPTRTMTSAFSFSVMHWFFIALSMGATLMLIPQAGFPVEVGQYGPALITILYGCMVLLNVGGVADSGYERAADSCYYLGFLLTLLALVISLVFLAEGPDGRPDRLSLVDNLGVALSTTLIGLLFRILKSNQYPHFDDVSDATGKSLQQQTSAFTSEVQSAQERIKADMSKIEGAITSSVEAAEKLFLELGEKHQQRLEELSQNDMVRAQALHQEHMDAIKSFKEKLQKTALVTPATLKKFEDAVDAIAVGTDRVTGSFDTLSTSTDSAAHSLERIPSTTQDVATGFKTLNQSISDQINVTTEKTKEALEQSKDALNTALSGVQAQVSASDQSARDLSVAVQATVEAVKSISTAVEGIGQLGETVGHQLQAVQKFEAALKSGASALDGVSVSMGRVGQSIENNSDSAVEAMEKMRAMSTQIVDERTEIAAQLRLEAEQAGQSLQTAADGFASLVHHLSEFVKSKGA